MNNVKISEMKKCLFDRTTPRGHYRLRKRINGRINMGTNRKPQVRRSEIWIFIHNVRSIKLRRSHFFILIPFIGSINYVHPFYCVLIRLAPGLLHYTVYIIMKYCFNFPELLLNVLLFILYISFKRKLTFFCFRFCLKYPRNLATVIKIV